MLRFAIPLAFVALTVPSLSYAQTMTLSTNLDMVPGSFDFGPVVTHRVDEDGDRIFDSFLQEARQVVSISFEHSDVDITYPKFRLIRVINGQICRGAWLDPKKLAGVTGTWNRHYARVDVVTAGTRQELQVAFDTHNSPNYYTWAHVKVFALDRTWVGCQ